jgi:lipoprotein-anchoring transpeptidase ErfK/SrfK
VRLHSHLYVNKKALVATLKLNGKPIFTTGTNDPMLIPGNVSHGEIRMRNADILRLAKLMPIGTPVTIR